MTNEELTAIEQESKSTMYKYDLWLKVPALVAEVRRLRAERDADLAASPALHDALIIAEGQRDQARAERDALRKDAELLREFVSSDEIAMTYQTLGQYRAALLKFHTAALAVKP